MAVFAFTNGYVALAGTEVSAEVKSVSLEIEADDLESTAMGATHRTRIGGLKDGTLTITFNQDVAASDIDSIVWGHFNTGTAITFELRAVNTTVGTSNPKWTGSVLPVNYTPLDGSVGDFAELSITWPTTGAVTRATA